MSSTPEQLAVIQNPNENKLVIALPGSGKTHTTVSLAEVITSNPTNTILMLTFANAAATEMGVKLAQRTCFRVGGEYCAKRYPIIGTCMRGFNECI